MRTTGVRGLAAVACLLVASGCGVADLVGGGGGAVLDTGVTPVPLVHDAPTYTYLDGRELVARTGAEQRRLGVGYTLGWLPDGNVLVNLRPRRTKLTLVDPAAGTVGPTLTLWEHPSRAVTRVNSLNDRDRDRVVLVSHDLSLGDRRALELPPTDNPDATDGNELARNYYGAVPTIDDVTFVKWHDSSEWYEDGDYGVLRIEGDDVAGAENVLINERIVGLYLSADGSGLLGLRQSSGKPCGGCVVDQDIVEIDPETGEIGAEYGVPGPYTDDWRVAAMDKVGDRVAVRYYDAVERGGRFHYEQRGTWVYDGDWSMLEGSDQELTWWQGEDRVVARIDDSERRRGDGYDLFWLHGDERTPLPGELSRTPQSVPLDGAVAGQLLPPA